MQLVDAGDVNLLVRQGRARDDSAWRICTSSSRTQARGNLGVVMARHVDHKRGAARNKLSPIGFFAAVGSLPREQNNCGRGMPLRKGNLGRGCRAESRSHAGYDFEINVALRRASISSPSRPKMNGSPLFSRWHDFHSDARANSTIRKLIS